MEGIFRRIHTGRSSHSWLFLISSEGSVKSDLGIGNPGMALWRWKPNVTNQMFTSTQGERSRWKKSSVQKGPFCSYNHKGRRRRGRLRNLQLLEDPTCNIFFDVMNLADGIVTPKHVQIEGLRLFSDAGPNADVRSCPPG